MALRTVGVRLTAEVSQYMTNMRRAGGATKQFVGEMDKAAKGGQLDHVADRAAVVGVGLAGMAGYAIKAAADFDKAMSSVRAATHASAKDMNLLREAALQAGKDTSFSATEAADGITELSKAGVSTSAILGGGLKGALDLAAAGQLSVGEAAETAASAMTQFKLSGKDVPHIADLLAAGAGKAQGSVHDMGMALSQSGLVASQFGLSVEDSTGTLAAFASAGLIGSDAGTSFKTMLLALANPAEKTKDTMDALGISAYNAQGKFVGVTALAEQLKTKLGGLTQAQRDAALAQIFGSDAIRAANVLYQQGGQGIQDWIGKVNDAGYASETARIQTDNLAGDLERLKGSIETLAIESGSGANGGLRTLVQALDGLVGQFGELPSAVGSSVTVLAGIGGVAALALAGFIKLRRGVASAVEELSSMGPAGEKAAGALGKVTSVAGKAVAVLAGLEVIGAVADHFGDASVNVDSLANSLTNYVNTGKAAGALSDVFGNDLSKVADSAQAADAASHGFWGGLNDLTSSIPGVSSVVDTLNEKIYGLSFNQAKDNMAGLNTALVNYMNTTNDAGKASELWNSILNKSGLNTQQLAALLPDAYKKLGELNNAAMGGKAALDGVAGGMKGAADAAGPAAKATKEYKTAADAAAGAARGEAAALTDLAARMKAEADPVFGFIKAQKDLAAAQKDAKQAQEDLDKAIDAHGPKSKEAKAASDRLKDSTEGLTGAAIDLQGRAGALGDSFNGKLSPAMRNTLKAANLTDAQIRIIEKSFKDAKTQADRYDGKYEAKASAPGAVDAKTKMADAWAQAKGFEGQYTAKLRIDDKTNVGAKLADLLIKQRQLASGLSYASARSAVQKDLDRNRQRKATGGPVYGAGTATSDSIPALLSNGEHVWTAAEVAALGGQAAMTSLRRAVKAGKRVEVGDETPGFALGGSVTWPFPTDVSKTKIPPMFLPGPSGGATDDWIVRTVKARFPGMNYISKFRPGAMTLTGNRSLHSMHRAVDWPASHALAQYWHDTFMAKTKELITPWNDLNIHNGRPHRYTGAVWNQHNFAGGNAHDHIAMKNGGTITEPVMGVGASGRTYSFGENYQPERVVPNWQPAGGGGAQITVVLENHGVIGSRAEVNNWLTGAVDDLKRKGRI